MLGTNKCPTKNRDFQISSLQTAYSIINFKVLLDSESLLYHTLFVLFVLPPNSTSIPTHRNEQSERAGFEVAFNFYLRESNGLERRKV